MIGHNKVTLICDECLSTNYVFNKTMNFTKGKDIHKHCNKCNKHTKHILKG